MLVLQDLSQLRQERVEAVDGLVGASYLESQADASLKQGLTAGCDAGCDCKINCRYHAILCADGFCAVSPTIRNSILVQTSSLSA